MAESKTLLQVTIFDIKIRRKNLFETSAKQTNKQQCQINILAYILFVMLTSFVESLWLNLSFVTKGYIGTKV